MVLVTSKHFPTLQPVSLTMSYTSIGTYKWPTGLGLGLGDAI